MKISFFPGCSLEGTAREYGESIKAVFEVFNIEMEEIPDWNCCGASSAHLVSDYLSLALPARNLQQAEKLGQTLVTPCPACYNRFKVAEKILTGGEKRIDIGISFKGSINIFHLLHFLTQNSFENKIERLVKYPLKNLRLVSYYGCLIVRPPKVTDEENCEDPSYLDRLIALLGSENLYWPYKTECCGGSLLLSCRKIVYQLTERLLSMAQEIGADGIVTACPLCQNNLDTRQEGLELKGKKYSSLLPIFYFTELMGLAFGIKESDRWFSRHLVDPRPLLKERKII